MLEQELTKHGLPDARGIAGLVEADRRMARAHGLNHHMLDRADPDATILPQQAVQALSKATSGDAYVTSDVGQHQMFAAQYYAFDAPRRWINSGGLGTMGFGLPAAMGVQFAFPDATVACVTGEGSFMMNMQELSTCLQYGLPIKIVNLNNAGARHGQAVAGHAVRRSPFAQHLRDALPDFVKLVESFGHVGIRVERLGELSRR